MTKEQLLYQLAHQNYVMIRPSGIHGIGVFAIRAIPKGCKDLFSSGIGEWIEIPKTEIAQLPDHAQAIVENYCLYDENNYFLPDYGFKVMDLVNFLNHSDTPNIKSVNDGEYFEALRDIAANEELFVDYGEIVGE
jgi:SET domain-containing protein